MKLFFPEWIILFPSTPCLCKILLFLKNALPCLICLANTYSFFKTLCYAFFDHSHLPQASFPWVDYVLVSLSLTHILIKYCNTIMYWHLVSPTVIPRRAWWDSWAQSLSVPMTFPEFQGRKIQPVVNWCIPFPILSQSDVPCTTLSVTSWLSHRFLRRPENVVWYSYLFKNSPQFVVIHKVKDFSVVNEAEVDTPLLCP